MIKRIAIIGTLDTKGVEIKYIKERIEDLGHKAIVMDVGVAGEVPFEPSVTRGQIAQAGGASLEEIIAIDNEAKSMRIMAKGASKILKELYSSDRLDGVLAVGGTVGTSLALTVMKALPIGVPKLIVSTVAFSPLVSLDLVSADLMMIQWAGGLRGLNPMCRGVLNRAVGAIIGAAEVKKETIKKPMVGVTSMGVHSCRYMTWLRPALEQRGYEVAVFHSQGPGGRALEQAITDGLINAVLDLSTHELMQEVYGGPCGAGEHRLEAAGKRGIPQIVSPGAIDGFVWGGGKPFPPRFRNRAKRAHNDLVTKVSTNKEEKAVVGRLIAEKLNKAKGPVAVVIPMGGFAEDDKPGGFAYDPEGREAFRRALKQNIKSEIKVVELEAHINDPAFAEEVMVIFDEIAKEGNP